MHRYVLDNALHLNCKNHDPLVRGSGHSAGPLWQYSKDVLNLRKSSILP